MNESFLNSLATQSRQSIEWNRRLRIESGCDRLTGEIFLVSRMLLVACYGQSWLDSCGWSCVPFGDDLKSRTISEQTKLHCHAPDPACKTADDFADNIAEFLPNYRHFAEPKHRLDNVGVLWSGRGEPNGPDLFFLLAWNCLVRRFEPDLWVPSVWMLVALDDSMCLGGVIESLCH